MTEFLTKPLTEYQNDDIFTTMSKSIEDQLRQAARKSGLSIKAMSVRAEIPYAGIHRFVTDDETSITLRTAARLATLLGMELRRVKRRKG